MNELNENQNQAQELEVMAPSAMHSLEAAACDIQVATAHKYPRSLELFKKRALAQVTMDSETAESCIYVREVGSKNVNGKWVKEYAEGMSIRMAEIAFNSYGNIRAESDIVEQTLRYVKARGRCWDVETNAASQMTVIEPTVKKNGEPYSENMRVTVAKAAQAKAWRDAVLKVIGKAVCKPLIEAAKKVMAGEGKTMEARLRKVQGWLNYRKIEEDRVFSAIGIQGWADVTEEHFLTLSGLKTAIMEGDQTIEEAFPLLNQPKAPDMPGKDKAPTKPKEKQPVATGPSQSATQAPKEADPKPIAQQTTKEVPPSAPAESEVLAAMGLAPAKAPEQPNTTVQEKAPETAVESKPADPAPTEEPLAQPDPDLGPKAGDSDALASVKMLGQKSGVTYGQVMGWARANKVAKPDQKLADLSEAKLITMGTRWATILPKIKEQAR